jgi:Zn finger protein HypA/HybF involved in hydrogenase expression
VNRRERVEAAEEILREAPVYKTCAACRGKFQSRSKFAILCDHCFDIISFSEEEW